MDEFDVVLKARAFVRESGITAAPVDVSCYAGRVKASVRYDPDMEADEAGCCLKIGEKYHICVNANDRAERQRFSMCHEIAHIVLGLPSRHESLPMWSYAKRPREEIFCDVFAAELLLPFQIFKVAVNDLPLAMESVETLAARFVASLTATGSRFAAVNTEPCAFVLSEQGKIRYAARSNSLRDEYAWIKPGIDLPGGSFSDRIRKGESSAGAEEIDAEEWLSDWERGGVLREEARYFSQWDQTLTLLWFKDAEIPKGKGELREDEEELGLEELDGNLRWPSKKRRR
jgi:hypothetical protein